jgi:hypothetical protein
MQPYSPGPPPPRRTNATAIAAMVVSLVSLATCTLLGAVGIYLGHKAQQEIAARGEEGEGMAKAGIIVGWVALGLTLLWVCAAIGIIGLGAAPALFP